jgi:hypothetical protein
MCFASRDEFREELTAAFCPENEATTAHMRLESDCYFQGKRNIEAYIDEFKDLINLSGYTDPIAIVLKFRHGLNPTTQDRIAESGTDRPQDRDFDGWFKAARCLDLNCCGEWCPSAFNSFELPSWMLYQDVPLLWDSGLGRGESGYSL